MLLRENYENSENFDPLESRTREIFNEVLSTQNSLKIFTNKPVIAG